MTLPDSGAEAGRDLVELRRSLRDVVALTMLPTVWAAYEPRQICADLVDVITRMIDVEGVYLTAPSNECGEILRLKHERDGETERRLRAAAAELATAPVQTVAGPGQPALRLLAFPLSFHTRDRFVVAARRPDFPTEIERLILRVAANQASTWLDWKRAEAAAAAESAFRRAIESSMAAGVAVVDASGRQTYVNRAFATMVGWTEAELVGLTPPFPYWAPEDGPDIEAAFREVTSGNINPAGYELLFRRRDGQRFDALVLVSAFEQPGRAPGFLASVHDITERKTAEHTARFLAEAGEILGRSLEYEDTLRAISDLVVPRFADWCFVDLVAADGGFRRIAVAHPPGAANEEIARRLQRAYAPKNALLEISETFARGTSSVRNEVTDDVLTAVSGDEHRQALLSMGVRCFVSVPMTSRGATLGVLTLLGTDVRTRFEPSDVALAEEVARRAALAVDNARLYRSAQDANRAKDEFLANLSHELRTPMTAILGWAHLLQLGDLDPDQVELGLRTIRQSGEAQAKLIDDLLDVSRIVTGKLHLNTADVRLADIARGAIAAIRPAADAKRHTLDVDVRAESALVLGDPSRLQQVFWNLLSNAVKFTPPGGVVSVRLADRDPDTVVLTVEDSGDGIAADFLPLVFERFRQAATAARGRSGLGLGLAIAKELVEMHGGTIAAASAGRGKGSTFTVTLPTLGEHRAPAERLRRADRPHERLRSLRVLLVEDDETTRTLLATVLGNFGANVTSASCAIDAEAALLTFEPQILITDIEMPGNDGVSLLHSLRGLKSATFPAVAVSGYADDASRERVLAAGFNGFVAKPLDPALLADEIVRALAAG